jgi:hypothetical protein
VEIAVFNAGERLGLTWAWIARTVNRLSHVRSAHVLNAQGTTCLPVIEDSFPKDLESQ